MNENMNVNEQIRRLMAAQGVTQAELARLSGIKAPNIHRMLKDGGNPTLASINLMAEALGCRVVVILERKEQKNV